jgi:hypothetical protein
MQSEIANIINTELKVISLNLQLPHIDPEDVILKDFWSLHGMVTFKADKDPLAKIFDALTKDRFRDLGQFNHFKSADIALEIIKSRSIQVSSLFANDENDLAEYTEYFKRTGTFSPLLSKDFQERSWCNKFNPSDETPADIERRNIFVLCFTQDNHNERFWTNYAVNDTGVCIGFRFSNFNEEARKQYDLRDVFYDAGYSLDFYNDINYKIRKFNKRVFTSGIVRFAKFYKRAKYAWENETRLCFHFDEPGIAQIPTSKFLENHFKVQSAENGRRYINLPLAENEQANPLFNLTVTEVVCGKYVPEALVNELREALANSFPTAMIWQRS